MLELMSEKEPVRSTLGRPPRAYATGRVTTWLGRSALLLTFGMSATLLASYGRLPETIPIHFNLAGQADGWGPRSAILTIVGICTVLTVGIVWLSRYPQIFNYPLEITEGNAQAVYREGERMLIWAACAISLLYLSTGLGTLFGFNPSPMITVAMAGLLGATGLGIVRLVRASR